METQKVKERYTPIPKARKVFRVLQQMRFIDAAEHFRRLQPSKRCNARRIVEVLKEYSYSREIRWAVLRRLGYRAEKDIFILSILKKEGLL
ncbi:MAG TPA: hypothetical protein VJA27_04150 [Patescibacteria group bacterium]|nr:hypothetical protein [Patescibacteria group bacterium]